MIISELKKADRITAFVLYWKGEEVARVHVRPGESPDRAHTRAQIIERALAYLEQP